MKYALLYCPSCLTRVIVPRMQFYAVEIARYVLQLALVLSPDDSR